MAHSGKDPTAPTPALFHRLLDPRNRATHALHVDGRMVCIPRSSWRDMD